jgi:RNA polymerase sigma-70 factor (ECF subfamily)
VLSASADSVTLPDDLAEELCRQANIARIGLRQDEFIGILREVGRKHNFNVSPGVETTSAQREAFWRGLHLRDLALAHACARGNEVAWSEFLREFRQPMLQAAIAITRSPSAGEELADSLYAELFGLTQREGVRSSPLASYSGRGALMGWLRATLAQRHVGQHRRTHREDPLEEEDYPATPTQAAPEPHHLARLSSAVREVLSALPAEDRFLLSAYFLDGHTLLEIATLLRVHEATVSRRIGKLTRQLHKQLLKRLEACGMSRRAAQEALGTDPRDLSLNLRNVLQPSQSSAFSDQGAQRAERT